jgi:hypothetical protein
MNLAEAKLGNVWGPLVLEDLAARPTTKVDMDIANHPSWLLQACMAKELSNTIRSGLVVDKVVTSDVATAKVHTHPLFGFLSLVER